MTMNGNLTIRMITIVSLSLNAVILFVSLILLQQEPNWNATITDKFKNLQIEKMGFSNLDPILNFQNHKIDFQNASALFNSVHGALKQKDSNLNPIGLSFIPASLPPNTRLYHSTHTNKIPESFEWVAMSIEFSYFFGNPMFRSHPNTSHMYNSSLQDFTVNGGGCVPEKMTEEYHKNRKGPMSQSSTLFTFQTKSLDRLLLLDGASAAKVSPEMDQQIILSKYDTAQRFDERVAAKKICEWGKSFGLQGIIRLEIGFEIIICDFYDNLELISNISVSGETDLFHKDLASIDPREGTPDILRQKIFDISSFDWLKSGSDVNNGENRIQLDFSRMVTAINKTFIDPDPFKRSISNISESLKDEIRDEIEHNFRLPSKFFRKTDWQVITNNIVNKFGPLLHILKNKLSLLDSVEHPNKALLSQVCEDIIIWTGNYVARYYNSESPKELRFEQAYNLSIIDFVYHTFPITTKSEIQIYSSIFQIQSSISRIIFDIFEFGSSSSRIIPTLKDGQLDEISNKLQSLKAELQELLNNLRWSFFTECSKKCAIDEICYVPTWGPSPFFSNFRGAKDPRWFDFDGETYRIGKDLHCISVEDISEYRNRTFW